MVEFHADGWELEEEAKGFECTDFDVIVVDELQVVVEEHQCCLLHIG